MRITTILLFSILMSLSGLSHAGLSDQANLQGRVVNVSNGDLLVVSVNHLAEVVKLSDVICPAPDEQGGLEARNFAKAMVMNKTVRISIDHRDHLGRIVGRIFLGRRCLNDELIRAGMARH